MKSANADEIFGFASDEIKSTHPPSRRISSQSDFIPRKWDLIEKGQVSVKVTQN